MAKKGTPIDVCIGIFGVTGNIIAWQISVRDLTADAIIYDQEGSGQDFDKYWHAVPTFTLCYRLTLGSFGTDCSDHKYKITADVQFSSGRNAHGETDFNGPEDGIVCGAKIPCPPGKHWDEITKACIPDVTPTCPAGQHWDGTTCVPDTVIIPPVTGFPPFTGNPLNPGDLVKWLGQVIQWFLQNIWISLASGIGVVVGAAWAALPEDARNFFTGWKNFFDGVKEFFTTPGEFYRKHAVAMFEPGSGTPVGLYTGGNQAEVKRAAQEARDKTGLSFDVAKMIQDAITEVGDTITSPFDTPVTVDTADNNARQAALAALGVITGATAINAAAEMIPTINATGIAFLTGAILQATGIGGYLSDYFSKKYDANIGVQLGYFWNEKYQNKIESIGNLISKRRKGLITNEEFTRDGIRVTGQSGESVRLDYKDSLQVPSLEDVLTYHFRHPTEPLDLGALQDLLGINYVDYKKYFDERQYGDVSIRFIQSAANLLGFSEEQVRELLRLNRLDPRVNPVLGMSPLDVAVKVMMSRKGIYDETQTVKEEKHKHFTYSLLIKLAEAGEDITGFMDADLTAEGWDTEHRTVLENYINTTIAAKAAKAKSSTQATPS